MTDSTNFSADYTRNRVRQTVIPALQAIQPSFYPLYSRMLGHLEEDEAFLEQTADEAFEKAQQASGLDAGVLGERPLAILFRVLRRYFGSHQVSCETVQMEAAQRLLRQKRGRIQLQKNCWLEWNAGLLSICRDEGEFQMAPLEVGPGKLPENSLASGCLRLLNCEQFTNLQKRECNILKKTIDYDKIYGRLFLRQKKEGDYLRLAHRKVGKPLRKWWNEQKIPPRQRSRIPVLSAEESPVWVYGLGADERVLPTKETVRFLVIDIEEEAL